MARETFILMHTKPFRRFLKLFIKVGDKTEQRSCEFTTAHKVSEKERNKGARKVAAEYSTANPVEIEALYRDSGYGTVFVHKDDPKGEKAKTPFKLTPTDKKKLALENLFKMAGMEFDPVKDSEVLEEEYHIHMTATSGKVIKQGAATSIPHEQVDVQKNMMEQAAKAREVYAEKYGESIPEEFSNDLSFLDALSNPEFDAKKYIEENSAPKTDGENPAPVPETVESVQKLYFETFNKNVAPVKKNDIGWMKAKIKEEQDKK